MTPLSGQGDCDLGGRFGLFFSFFCSGVGNRRSHPSRWPGGWFLLEVRGRGGVAEEEAGARRAQALGACLPGGGATFLFRGRNAHQVTIHFKIITRMKL